MLKNCMNINFNVLIDNEDRSKLKNLMTEFVNELNNSSGSYIELKNDVNICGVSSVKFKDNYMADITPEPNIMDDNVLEKVLKMERENPSYK